MSNVKAWKPLWYRVIHIWKSRKWEREMKRSVAAKWVCFHCIHFTNMYNTIQSLSWHTLHSLYHDCISIQSWYNIYKKKMSPPPRLVAFNKSGRKKTWEKVWGKIINYYEFNYELGVHKWSYVWYSDNGKRIDTKTFVQLCTKRIIMSKITIYGGNTCLINNKNLYFINSVLLNSKRNVIMSSYISHATIILWLPYML